MGEFELIRRYFQHPLKPPGVALGNGDDCALLAPTPGMRLAVSTDMLVEGRHFLSTVSPEALGHKALAVNLSDLAAMGAQPLAFTLALSMPRVDERWLAGFSSGLLALADVHQCALVGGDTTAGPLNMCITVFGQVPEHLALRRDAAQVGDDIYVSGCVGDARLALEVVRGTQGVDAATWEAVRQRMERPTPRVALGLALRGVAHAAVDVSDGLLGDLQHILSASALGADLCDDLLMNSVAISPYLKSVKPEFVSNFAWAGGDDYELVFTAPPAARAAVAHAAVQSDTPVTRIGHTTAEPGIRVRASDGQVWAGLPASFDHFV
ncbi:MAG: thiamine-phosphate kinase [Burkholderiaceae bacterium]|nr:thiamine-phosphate kinase [Burkholderiaceae bacterium]